MRSAESKPYFRRNGLLPLSSELGHKKTSRPPAMMSNYLRIFVLYALYHCHRFAADAVEFTSNPPTSIFALKNFGVWLQWQYNTFGLKPASFECFFDAGYGKTLIIKEKNGLLTPVGSYSDRMMVYQTNRTFAIWGLKYSDSGAYSCTLMYNIQIPFIGERLAPAINSRITTLTVEGAPEFCGTPLKDSVVVQEGNSVEVAVTVCGKPAADIIWKVGRNGNVQRVGTGPTTQEGLQQTGVVTLSEVKRDQCGLPLIVSGQNKVGISAEKEIAIQVKFKPHEPPVVQAVYDESKECVDVSWKGQASPLCADLRHIVVFSTEQGVLRSSEVKQQEMVQACIPDVAFVNVTAVTSLGSASRVVNVMMAPKTPRATTQELTSPTTGASTEMTPSGKASANRVPLYAGLGVGLVVIICVLAICVIYWRRKVSALKKSKEEKNIVYDKEENYAYVDQGFRPAIGKPLDNATAGRGLGSQNPYLSAREIERPGIPPPLPKRNILMGKGNVAEEDELSPLSHTGCDDEQYLSVIGVRGKVGDGSENGSSAWRSEKGVEESPSRTGSPPLRDNLDISKRADANGSRLRGNDVGYWSVPRQDPDSHYQPLVTRSNNSESAEEGKGETDSGPTYLDLVR